MPTTARDGEGLPFLLQAISDVASGRIHCQPSRLAKEPPALKGAINELVSKIKLSYPDLPNPRWVALRLLGGDDHIAEALRKGEWFLSRRDSTIVARHEVPGIMRKIAPSQRDG